MAQGIAAKIGTSAQVLPTHATLGAFQFAPPDSGSPCRRLRSTILGKGAYCSPSRKPSMAYFIVSLPSGRITGSSSWLRLRSSSLRRRLFPARTHSHNRPSNSAFCHA
jgi:hypothetical protein